MSFALRVFSTTDTKDKITIDFRELKRLINFIFKLSLETSNEILLDYDLEELANAVTLDAFKHSGVEDIKKGLLDFKQVMSFINKVSTQEMRG